MPLALTDDHRDLADSVAAFARRAAPLTATRASFDRYAAGGRPEFWDTLRRDGLHAIHLPERYGGADAGLPELAVVVEQLAHSLVPGPYVPTVITSAVLAAAPESDLVAELVGAFGDGATGALVLSGDLTAVRGGDSAEGAAWNVEGISDPVLGLPGAEVVLVRASVKQDGVDDSEGDPVWFRLREGATATVHTDEGTDLTRSVGRLELTGHPVIAADVLPALEADRVELTVNALLAAEASGLTRWCVGTAVDYVRTREQFGKPVGSFQAVQHKAALMLLDAEITCAAAWDAARAAEQGGEQRRLAAAQAALTALPRGIDTALACVTLLGGIGFTWEHDVHLYWRRAVSIAAVVGTDEQSATRLGEAALVSTRDFSFVDDSEFADLRAQVGSVLNEVLGGDAETRSAGGGARQARLAEAGLVAPHYPQPYGLGAGPAEQAVIAREFARRGLEQPTTIIGEWVLPTLLVHGSEAQKQRFIGPSLRGEIVWCQLFSEPGAGSDLAALSTKANKIAGGWSLSGQKVWTSKAHEADWGVCLARTDPDAPKHRGISYFLVDMRSPGVDVRPLHQSTGRAEFNEVFLDDVFVPDDCLVAEPGQGWKLAATTLTNERLSMGTRLTRGSTQLLKTLIASGQYGGSRAEAVRVLGRNTGREMALAALSLRSVLGRLSGLDVGSEISVQKVFSAIAQRDGSRAMLGVLGPQGCLSGPLDAPHTDPVLDHIGLPAVLFGGGTIEIQLNVIAQRVLGLPR
ncbi:MAG: acyl-CoA dehydrogenase [Mycobacteriaceae bacterium]